MLGDLAVLSSLLNCSATQRAPAAHQDESAPPVSDAEPPAVARVLPKRMDH